MQPQNFFPAPQDGSPQYVVDLSDVLVADGVTRNELLLVRAQEKAPRNSLFVWPAANKPLYFEALPKEFWNYLGEPVAINCDFRGSSFAGRGFNSLIQLGYGTAGIQTTAGLADGISTFRNFRIHGPGRGAGSDGKEENGQWSRDLGKYVHSGINADNKTVVEDVNIWHMSGNAVRGYGWKDQHAAGKAILVTGTLAADFFFWPSDSSILGEAKLGWGVTVQGIETSLGGVSDVYGYLYVNPAKGITPGENVLLSITPKGGALIADNSDFIRVNGQFCGGAAYFFKGDDSNQHLIEHGTCALNGMHAIADYSFLGINATGVHAAHNGENFKDTDEWVPSYHLEAGKIGDCYDEEGGAPAYLGDRAEAIGIAKMYNGFTGPGVQLGRVSRNFYAGGARFDDRGISFEQASRSQPTMLRTFPGDKFGLGYGEEAAGQSPHLQLLPVRAGDHLTNDDGKEDENSRAGIPLDGIAVPALYVQGVGVFAAPTLGMHLDKLGEREARPGDLVSITGDTAGPRQYVCQAGGNASECRFQPATNGVGPVADRPTPEQLTRHAVGYRWLSAATSTETVFTGQAWVSTKPDAPLVPLVRDFLHDSDPRIFYTPGYWKHHVLPGTTYYRGDDAVTRTDKQGDGAMVLRFTSQGHDDEWVALHLPALDPNALFSLYLNDELVAARDAPDGAFLSYGSHLIQHFQTTPYHSGDSYEYPSVILQPVAGPNVVTFVSHTPAGAGAYLYADGWSLALRGEVLPPALA